MRKLKRFAAAALLCAALGISVTAGASGPPALSRWVNAGGGGPAASGLLLLRATAGQGVTGLVSAGGTALCAGFWCAGLPGSALYLPLTVRP